MVAAVAAACTVAAAAALAEVVARRARARWQRRWFGEARRAHAKNRKKRQL